MGYTKGQFVQEALEELGIADYDFDVIPEQMESGVRKLDSMMMQWNSKGIYLAYPSSSSGESPDPSTDTDVPDFAWEAVITNLALRLAPGYGKAVNLETKVAAKNALNAVMSRTAAPLERRLDKLPKGAGYKAVETNFLPIKEDPNLKPIDQSFDVSGGPV